MTETLKARLSREYLIAQRERLRHQFDSTRSQLNEIRSQLDYAENKANEAIAACDEAYNDCLGKASEESVDSMAITLTGCKVAPVWRTVECLISESIGRLGLITNINRPDGRPNYNGLGEYDAVFTTDNGHSIAIKLVVK